MAEHSPRYSASSFFRRMACRGSAQAEEGMPDTSSSYAEEGTAAHALAAELLALPDDNIRAVDYIGTPMDNGWVVDDEMTVHVQDYVTFVQGLARDNSLLVEERVSYEHLAPNGFGTADALVLDIDQGVLHVIDFKYGKGVRVEARANPQMMLYAIGALHTFEALFDDVVERVSLTVYQPRLDHIDTWSCDRADLAAFAHVVNEVVAECELPDPEYIPGSHCRWCKAQGSCHATARASLAVVTQEPVELLDLDRDFSPVDPVSLSGEQVSRILPHLDMVEGWLKGVREHAQQLLQTGHAVPGYKLVAGRPGPRKWADESAVETAMRKARVKVADMFKQTLISPTQAEKLLPGVYARLTDYVTQSGGKPSVVPEADKRPSITVELLALENEA